MTASRARFDQRIAGLGPDILAPELDEAGVPAPAARGRPDAPDRRRADRPADHRRDRQPVEGRGLLRGRHRSVAAHRRRLRRGGAGDRPRHAPADAGVRARRHAGPLQGRLRHRRPPVPALRRAPRTSAHAARATTTGRHTGAQDVSAEADRPQGRGPDRPGQHARVVRRRAGPRRRHDRVRRAARAPARAGRRPAAARPRLRARRRRADARGRASPTSRRSPFDGVELDVDLKLPGYEERVVAALREHGLVERTLVSSNWMRSLVEHPRAGAGAAARLVGPAPASSDPTQIVADQAARLRRRRLRAGEAAVGGQGRTWPRAAATR